MALVPEPRFAFQNFNCGLTVQVPTGVSERNHAEGARSTPADVQGQQEFNVIIPEGWLRIVRRFNVF